MKAFFANNKTAVHLLLLMAAIVVAYSKIFNAPFAVWDDMDYVVNNKDIAAWGIKNITAWFTGFYIGTYQPVTMASYALDHLFGAQQPFVYHLVNLLLHVGNATMLYFLVNKIQRNSTVGFIVALLFALNPVQTETVSWIAERKTLLCAFFYLLAMLQYIRYIAKPSAVRMMIVCLLGILAMLSKAVAVALPVSLIAVDVWLQQDIKSRKLWLNKIPLFIVAVIIGIVAIRAQQAGKFLGLHPEYNWFDTIMFASYAYVQYIIHFFVPVRLSVLYPYPNEIGWLQYLYLLITIGIVFVAIVAYRKKWHILLGGIIFYTVNIVLLLQFIQFGEVLMADRYLYIACIGLLVPAVYYFISWLQKLPANIPSLIGYAIAIIFLVTTFFRNEIWLSDFNFFTSILEVFPNSAVAQYSVGGLYMRMGNYPEAEEYMNRAVLVEPGNYKAWYDLGLLYLRERKPAKSLEALNKCLGIKEYSKAYFSRAQLYEGTGQPALALADIEKVLEEQPENARAFYIKGDCLEQQGNITDALGNYNKAIQYENNEPLFYIRRGLVYAKTKQPEAALNDLNTAVALNPDNGEALYFRGVIKYRNGGDPCDDLKSALSHGIKEAQEILTKACNH